MGNNITDNSHRIENVNQNIHKTEPKVPGESVGIDKNKIANVCGIIGGAIFFILNLSTKGKVPGGFIGGIVGYLIGYGIAWIVLSLVSRK
jgi:hypothetical protein